MIFGRQTFSRSSSRFVDFFLKSQQTALECNFKLRIQIAFVLAAEEEIYGSRTREGHLEIEKIIYDFNL